MLDRIPLTDKDILLGYDEITFKGFRHIICQCETKEQAQQLKQQILDDSKFREEYNKPYSIRITYQKLEEENKKLKEDKKS